jgi:hypothetical protein
VRAAIIGVARERMEPGYLFLIAAGWAVYGI